MRKVWLVARQEFLTNIHKRSFLFAAIGGPLMTILLMVVVIGITLQSETDLSRFSTVGVVDQAGVIVQYDDMTLSYEEPPMPMFLRYEDEAAAEAALDGKQIGAYLVLPPDYLSNGALRLISSTGASEALTESIDAYLLRNLGERLDPALLERIMHPADMSVRFLNTGRTIPIEGVFGLFMTPLIFVTIFMIAAQTTSGYLMSGVVEEKTNRIMEILITSISPTQLLAGKIIGLGALGLVQLVIWLVIAGGGSLLAQRSGSELLSSIFIPPDMAFAGLIYFILGYFFLATAMASIGVIVGSEQESRQYAGIFSLLMAVPFFALINFFTDPSGPLPTALSIIPFTAPTSMILRMTFTAVPAEQFALSIGLLIVLNLLILVISARIFRFALLMYGKKLNLRQMIGLLRRPSSAALISRAGEGSAT
ncbi:MAG: ABC transporter permease [Anaerolineae bacterium]|nr:ABC transporter permease [Anaerolineae bacterium]NUQ03918.1 ABC transporter permease [Anaerolineae bacterium]